MIISWSFLYTYILFYIFLWDFYDISIFPHVSPVAHFSLRGSMGHEFGVGLAYAYRSHGIKGVVAISGQAMASGRKIWRFPKIWVPKSSKSLVFCSAGGLTKHGFFLGMFWGSQVLGLTMVKPQSEKADSLCLFVWKMSFNPSFGFEDEDMDAPKTLTPIGKMRMNHERNGYRPSDIGPDWMIFRGPPSKESHKDLLTHPP